MSKTVYYIFFLISLFCDAQHYTKTDVLSWYDSKTISETSQLFRGIEYVEKHRMLNEKHKFFKTIEYKKGKLVYGGQLYDEVSMKYNIYDDILLVNIELNQNNLFFQLFSNEVEEFSILGHNFKYIKSEKEEKIKGFYETMNNNVFFKIYKKHLVRRGRIKKRNQYYYEFNPKRSNYIYEYEGKYYLLTKSTDLISEFPNFKSEINYFFKAKSKSFRNDPDIFMKKLAAKMNLILSTNYNDVSE